jgi:hypothetical protein
MTVYNAVATGQKQVLWGIATGRENLGAPRIRQPLVAQRRPGAATKRDSLRPTYPSSFNTEYTERLSDLRVEALRGTEGTEARMTRGKIFAAQQRLTN